MGKQLYLTNIEVEWLKDKLVTLSGMGLYWEDEEERKVLDSIYDKIAEEWEKGEHDAK